MPSVRVSSLESGLTFDKLSRAKLKKLPKRGLAGQLLEVPDGDTAIVV